MATDDTKPGDSAPSDSPPPGEAVEQPGSPPEEDEPKTFDASYVAALREEAAAQRVRAKRAADAEDRLRALAIADATRGTLADPTDLLWSDEMADDDGWPDPEKIRTAAEALTQRKPHLARPTGDVGQGRHSDDESTVNLADLLRAGA